jgi:hypothetical protein
MKYAILIYEPASEFAHRTDAQAQEYWAGWMAYTEQLRQAGVMTGGAGLEPPTVATRLQLVAGKRRVQDGPYAETKEQLGGFYLIDVPNLDEALKWAEKCPAYATGVLEIRPLLNMPSDG